MLITAVTNDDTAAAAATVTVVIDDTHYQQQTEYWELQLRVAEVEFVIVLEIEWNSVSIEMEWVNVWVCV